MRFLLSMIFIFLSYGISAQITEVKETPKSQTELSDELLIKAGYAFRYNDLEEALKLYKEAKNLNPKNEVVEILIKIVEKKIDDKIAKVDDHLLAREKEAINSLKNEGLMIFDLSSQLTNDAEKQLNTNFAIMLLRASEKKGEFILQGIEQSFYNPPNFYFEDRKSRMLDDLIFLGEKYCKPEDIFAWKHFFLGLEEKNLRDKLENYIISLNYNPAFNPSISNLKSISLNASFNRFQNTIQSKGSIPITDNPIFDDYNRYSTAHPSIINELILQNQNELKRSQLLPWKVFGSMAIPGAIGVALLSNDSTKIIFLEERDGRTKLSNTGKAVDSIGWALLLGAIPTTIAVYPFKKIKNLKSKIDYLSLYVN